MQNYHFVTSPAESCKKVRPLLSISRLETGKFCSFWKLPLYPDTSNKKVKFSRNRVRKQLVPMLKLFFNSKIENVLLQFTEIIDVEDKYLNQITKQLSAHFDQPLSFFPLLYSPLFSTLVGPTRSHPSLEVLQSGKLIVPINSSIKVGKTIDWGVLSDTFSCFIASKKTLGSKKNVDNIFVDVQYSYLRRRSNKHKKSYFELDCPFFLSFTPLFSQLSGNFIPNTNVFSWERQKFFNMFFRTSSVPAVQRVQQLNKGLVVFPKKAMISLAPSASSTFFDDIMELKKIYKGKLNTKKKPLSTYRKKKQVSSEELELKNKNWFVAKHFINNKVYIFYPVYQAYKFSFPFLNELKLVHKQLSILSALNIIDENDLLQKKDDHFLSKKSSFKLPKKLHFLSINMTNHVCYYPISTLEEGLLHSLPSKKGRSESCCDGNVQALRAIAQDFATTVDKCLSKESIHVFFNNVSCHFKQQNLCPEASLLVVTKSIVAPDFHIQNRRSIMLFQREIVPIKLIEGVAIQSVPSLPSSMVQKIEMVTNATSLPSVQSKIGMEAQIRMHNVSFAVRFSVPIGIAFWIQNKRICIIRRIKKETETTAIETSKHAIIPKLPENRLLISPSTRIGQKTIKGKRLYVSGLRDSSFVSPCTNKQKSLSSFTVKNHSVNKTGKSTDFQKKGEIYPQNKHHLGTKLQKSSQEIESIFNTSFFLYFDTLKREKRNMYWPILISFLPKSLQQRVVKDFLTKQPASQGNSKKMRYSQIQNFLTLKAKRK